MVLISHCYEGCFFQPTIAHKKHTEQINLLPKVEYEHGMNTITVKIEATVCILLLASVHTAGSTGRGGGDFLNCMIRTEANNIGICRFLGSVDGENIIVWSVPRESHTSERRHPWVVGGTSCMPFFTIRCFVDRVGSNHCFLWDTGACVNLTVP